MDDELVSDEGLDEVEILTHEVEVWDDDDEVVLTAHIEVLVENDFS